MRRIHRIGFLSFNGEACVLSPSHRRARSGKNATAFSRSSTFLSWLGKSGNEQRGDDKTADAQPEGEVIVMQFVKEPASHQGAGSLTERQGNALEASNGPIGALPKANGHHL